MPRYHVHIAGDEDLHYDLDSIGLEFPSDEEAVVGIVAAIKDLRAEEFASDEWTGWRVEIVQAGRMVRRLSLEGF